MAKTTHANLRQKVADMIMGGTATSTTTNPTTAEVTRWLNDGQKDLVRVLPSQVLKELLTQANPNIAAVSEYALSSISNEVIKPHSFTYNHDGNDEDVPARLVDTDYANNRISNNYIANRKSPIYWFDGDKIKWYPATTGAGSTGKIKFIYVKPPTDLAGEATTISISEELEEPVILFACYKYYSQEEEPALIQSYYQLYTNAWQTVAKNWGIKLDI